MAEKSFFAFDLFSQTPAKEAFGKLFIEPSSAGNCVGRADKGIARFVYRLDVKIGGFSGDFYLAIQLLVQEFLITKLIKFSSKFRACVEKLNFKKLSLFAVGQLFANFSEKFRALYS